MLSPKFRPLPKHNPFAPLDREEKTGALARSGKPGKPGKGQHGTTRAADVRDLGLVLNATCIIGRQRMAIINGHVYKEKDTIPQPGDETPTCFITAIFPHEVLLSCHGEAVQLGYLNIASKPANQKNPQKPPK